MTKFLQWIPQCFTDSKSETSMPLA